MLRFATAEDDRNKVVSALAQLEARSAIRKYERLGRIAPPDAVLALDSLTAELRRMIEQPVNPQVLDAARSALDRHSLRALDAIQLGSAVVARDLLAAPDMRFVSSDVDLLDAAKAEGFDIWDPTT
jgi:predicted nucleic acid-binding protein